jgi:hypothetical protein
MTGEFRIASCIGAFFLVGCVSYLPISSSVGPLTCPSPPIDFAFVQSFSGDLIVTIDPQSKVDSEVSITTSGVNLPKIEERERVWRQLVFNLCSDYHSGRIRKESYENLIYKIYEEQISFLSSLRKNVSRANS